MKSLHFLNMIFAKLLGEKCEAPVKFFFIYFPAEIFKFSFNSGYKIGWPPGHLDRVSVSHPQQLLSYWQSVLLISCFVFYSRSYILLSITEFLVLYWIILLDFFRIDFTVFDKSLLSFNYQARFHKYMQNNHPVSKIVPVSKTV